MAHIVDFQPKPDQPKEAADPDEELLQRLPRVVAEFAQRKPAAAKALARVVRTFMRNAG